VSVRRGCVFVRGGPCMYGGVREMKSTCLSVLALLRGVCVCVCVCVCEEHPTRRVCLSARRVCMRESEREHTREIEIEMVCAHEGH